MEHLNDKMSDKEKIIYVIKELYENSVNQEEKEKYQKILVKLKLQNDKDISTEKKVM